MLKYIVLAFVVALNLNAGCIDPMALKDKYVVNQLSGKISFIKEIDDVFCVPADAKIFIFDNKEQAVKYSQALKNAENLGMYEMMLFLGILGMVLLAYYYGVLKGEENRL